MHINDAGTFGRLSHARSNQYAVHLIYSAVRYYSQFTGSLTNVLWNDSECSYGCLLGMYIIKHHLLHMESIAGLL